MGSLFDVPLHLVMILALAIAGDEGRAPQPDAMTSATATSTGPYLFSEQVWLEALKGGAGGEELAQHTQSIFRTSGGRYYVPAEAHRQQILGLRRDPDIAALVAFDLARRNAAALPARIGRPATVADLYVAHALGLETAAVLIPAKEKTPHLRAAKVVPALAQIEQSLRSGSAHQLTVAGLVKRLTRSIPDLEAAAGKIAGQQARQVVADRGPLALRGGLMEPVGMLGGPGLAEGLAWSTEIHNTR